MTTILNQNILEIIYEYLDNEIELITNVKNTEIVSVIYNCKMCDRIVGYPKDLINNYCRVCFIEFIFDHLCEEITYRIRKNNYMKNYVIFHKNNNNIKKLFDQNYTYTGLIIKFLQLKTLFNQYKISENIEKLRYVIDELKILRNILLITIN